MSGRNPSMTGEAASVALRDESTTVLAAALEPEQQPPT
jgi:hypothetical protein